MSAGDVARIVLQPQMSAAPIARLAPIVDFPAAGAPRSSTRLCSLIARTLRRCASVITSRCKSSPMALRMSLAWA